LQQEQEQKQEQRQQDAINQQQLALRLVSTQPSCCVVLALLYACATAGVGWAQNTTPCCVMLCCACMCCAPQESWSHLTAVLSWFSSTVLQADSGAKLSFPPCLPKDLRADVHK
jgi:hypothetical protein